MNRAASIWIVLGLVVLGILLILAFRSPADVDESMDQAATSTAQAMNRAAARTEASAELTALQARVVAGETYDSLKDDFAKVRTNLAAAYENVEGEAAQEWAEISSDFDEFEASAREGTSNFLDVLARLIARFSADVRVESPGE
ncbi:MAG: hypothetical protein Q8S19_08850 [Bacillota bacterium]|nr:hypothetical protein [Bacillota bacterium]